MGGGEEPRLEGARWQVDALVEHGVEERAEPVGALPGGSLEVGDGVHALLVPPGDPGALAAALVRLAEDGALRERLAEGARRLAAGPLSPAGLAAPLAAELKGLGEGR